MAVDIDLIFRTYNKNWKIRMGFLNYKILLGKESLTIVSLPE